MSEGQEKDKKKKKGFLLLEVFLFSKSSFVSQASLSVYFPLTSLEKITEQMKLHMCPVDMFAPAHEWAVTGEEWLS